MLAHAVVRQSDDKPAKAGQGGTVNKLAEDEKRLGEKYQRLENALLRMAEMRVGNDAKRTALIRKAVAKSKDELIAVRFQRLVDLLGRNQLAKALENQQVLDADLAALLELLMSEDQAKRFENEKKKLQRWIEEISELIKVQKDIYGRTTGGDNQNRLAKDQYDVAQKTGGLAKEMQKGGGQKPGGEAGKPGEGDQKAGKGEAGKGKGDTKGGKGEARKGEEGKGKGEAGKGKGEAGKGKGEAGKGKGEGKGEGKGDGKGQGRARAKARVKAKARGKGRVKAKVKVRAKARGRRRAAKKAKMSSNRRRKTIPLRRLEEAQKAMEEAQKELEQAQREGAADKEQKALDKLNEG